MTQVEGRGTNSLTPAHMLGIQVFGTVQRLCHTVHIHFFVISELCTFFLAAFHAGIVFKHSYTQHVDIMISSSQQ